MDNPPPEMLRLIQVTLAASLSLACAPPSPASEPSVPTAPAARFTAEEGGNPEVGIARLRVLEAGKLSLPDGQLAVSDAFINDYPLVISELPPGGHSVEVLVAEAKDDERIAAARVRVGTEPVATWKPVGFFAVDSGTGAFFDPRISPAARIERFNEMLLKALETSTRSTYSLASIPWEGRTFVAFSTGWGDGRYPVYLGSATSGAPSVVLVDCEILPWPQ